MKISRQKKTILWHAAALKRLRGFWPFLHSDSLHFLCQNVSCLLLVWPQFKAMFHNSLGHTSGNLAVFDQFSYWIFGIPPKRVMGPFLVRHEPRSGQAVVSGYAHSRLCLLIAFYGIPDGDMADTEALCDVGRCEDSAKQLQYCGIPHIRDHNFGCIHLIEKVFTLKC